MENVNYEISRIEKFINNYVQTDEKILIPVSGGLDSDVVARLCAKALGKERIKLIIVIESDMEKKFINNAHYLAKDLNVPLTEISLERKNIEFINILEQAENEKIFDSSSLLDSTKIKGSLRTTIISCYQDKGYIIAGCTNRTEYELGFFITFGDYLANLKPIQHLYKTEIIELARALKTNENVIRQKSSAGFWKHQEDLEDLSYWILNNGPIIFLKSFSDKEIKMAEQIKISLSWNKIDLCLKMINMKNTIKEIELKTNLSKDIIERIVEIVKKAKKYKSRPILASMYERHSVF